MLRKIRLSVVHSDPWALSCSDPFPCFVLAERVASDSQTVFVILNCHAMNFQHLLVSQGLYYSLQAFGQIHASPNMCFPLQYVFASSFGLGLSDANAKARAVIPILRKFTVARLLEPHCKLWTWADLGGLAQCHMIPICWGLSV